MKTFATTHSAPLGGTLRHAREPARRASLVDVLLAVAAPRVCDVARSEAALGIAVAALVVSGCGGSAPRPSTATTARHTISMVLRIQDLETHQLDLQAVFGGENPKRGPAASELLALPCPHRDYLYAIEAGSLGSSLPETFSAEVVMGAARLPPDIRCDKPLPASLGNGRLRITVAGDGGLAGYETDYEIEGERRSTGELVGILPRDLSNTICDGRYQLTAHLRTRTRRLDFYYPFVLRGVTATPKRPECN